jgi:predicted nucleic acid-binding protein
MASARGRPAATWGVFAIEDPTLLLPERFALDTSLVVRALIEAQPLHEACSAFLERLVEAEVTLVSSDLLEVELAEAAFGIALRERWGREWRRYRVDGRTRRRARRLLHDVRSRYELLLAPADHVLVPVAPVAGDAATLMVDFGLASYAAVHAASAIAAGAEAIATTDTGFALLPSSLLAIYTDRSRLAACRAKRPRR